MFEVQHYSHPNDLNLESFHFLFNIDGYVINGLKICSHKFWKRKQI